MFFLNSIHLRSVLLLLLLQAFFQNTTSFPSLSLYPEGSQLSAKFSLQMAFFSLCYFIIAGVWTSSSSQLQFGLSLHSSDLSFPHLHWAAPFFGLLKLWFGFQVSSSLNFSMRRSLSSSFLCFSVFSYSEIRDWYRITSILLLWISYSINYHHR